MVRPNLFGIIYILSVSMSAVELDLVEVSVVRFSCTLSPHHLLQTVLHVFLELIVHEFSLSLDVVSMCEGEVVFRLLVEP
jgi:hypothetical protein